jgi:hypothetical protein
MIEQKVIRNVTQSFRIEERNLFSKGRQKGLASHTNDQLSTDNIQEWRVIGDENQADDC